MSTPNIPAGAGAERLPVVAEVHPYGATVRLEWASVRAAHNAKPGPLCSVAVAEAIIDRLERELATLKAQPADVDAIMEEVDKLRSLEVIANNDAHRGTSAEYETSYADVITAREALRTHLAAQALATQAAARDAARYQALRRKVCIIGAYGGDAKFHILNLDPVADWKNDSASTILDTAIDAALKG